MEKNRRERFLEWTKCHSKPIAISTVAAGIGIVVYVVKTNMDVKNEFYEQQKAEARDRGESFWGPEGGSWIADLRN